MQRCSCIQAEASSLEEIAVPASEPVDPMAAWGKAFDTASAQLAAHTNPLELYEFSDLRGLHDINIVEHDGAIEYEEKCHELSIAALSAVKSGLGSQHANLSHCRLSRKGAHALAHALACNVKIQRLTLQSNHIDGVVSGDMLAACVEASYALTFFVASVLCEAPTPQKYDKGRCFTSSTVLLLLTGPTSTALLVSVLQPPV